MTITTKIPFVVELAGDGETTTLLLSIATSPAFIGVLHLDSPRAHAPASVELVRVDAGPDSYVAPTTPRVHRHRPMIDGIIEHLVEVHHQDGTVTHETRARPGRVEGPEVELVVHDVGDPPPLPKVSATVSDGLLKLELSPAIIAGHIISIVGNF